MHTTIHHPHGPNPESFDIHKIRSLAVYLADDLESKISPGDSVAVWATNSVYEINKNDDFRH